MAPNDRLMTLPEVADRLTIPLATLYQWRLKGFGPKGIKLGRHVRVRESEVELFLERQADRRPAA